MKIAIQNWKTEKVYRYKISVNCGSGSGSRGHEVRLVEALGRGGVPLRRRSRAGAGLDERRDDGMYISYMMTCNNHGMQSELIKVTCAISAR